MPNKSKFQISRSLDERIKRIIGGPNEFDSEFAQVSSAYILGFNYGNVTNCVGLTTNYQLHHAVFPVVGLAFFKTPPTDDDIKSNLKQIKEYSSSPNGLGSFKSDKNEHLFLIYSVDKETKEVDKRIFNFSKGTFVRRKRLRLNILNDPYCPRHVYNGSEDIFNLDDADSLSSADDDQIDHLIFFIHGVGGVCDVRFRSCVEVVADFKKMANSLLEQHSNPSSGTSTPTNRHLAHHLKKGFFRKHSTESSRGSDFTGTTRSSPSRSRTRKVECLPISWHSLTRRQTGVNEQLSLIALSSVPKLRHFLNKVVMDALLYSTGPVYTQTIINNVGNEINRLYTLFMEKHPNFNGSVSLAGHSLGSVIVFDLLAHQIPQEPSRTTESNASLNYNNNDNNNNNNIGRLINDRQNCLNASHHHHNMKSNDFGYCSDYNNLEDLLKDMDLTQYAELFHREHIDINSLLLLTDLDMKELNLPLGARRKLGTYINFKKVSHIQLPSGMSQQEQHNTQSRSEQQSSSSENDDNNSAKTGNNSNFNVYGNMNTGQCLVEYPQLKFKPRCFFAFGSPTPMFLNVRGMQNLSGEYKLPTCDRMFNIFHPYDPLAYRFEPLIDPRFKNVEPVLIPHHRGGKRIHVQLREGFARVGHDIKHRLLGSIRNTWTSFTRFNAPETSRDPSRSPSIEESLASIETSGRRLTKSASSSVDVEVTSFESANEQLDISHPRPRNPLKRQKPIARSQSDTNGLGLNSIIENSIREDINSESESGTDAIVLDQMRSFKLGDNNECLQSSKWKRSTSNNKSQKKKRSKTATENKNKQQPNDNQKEGESLGEAEFDTSKVGRLNGGRRIDYVLQEKPIELFNEYIFAFTSHANYWQNEDSALIILNEIYQVDSIQIFDHVE